MHVVLEGVSLIKIYFNYIYIQQIETFINILQQYTSQLLHQDILYNIIEIRYYMQNHQKSSLCLKCQVTNQNHENIQLKKYIQRNSTSLPRCQLENEKQEKLSKLQKEVKILKHLKQQQDLTIQKLKSQIGSKQRKNSIQFEVQQNKKQIQKIKMSLLTLGPISSSQIHFGQNREDLQNSTSQVIINSLQKRLKQYQLELVKLIQKVQIHQHSTEWMYHFIDNFIKMMQDINNKRRFNQIFPKQFKPLSLKKKALISWKYLKDILDKLLNTNSK